MKVTKKCEHCGKEFVATNGMKKYCCVECATAAKAARVKKQQDFYRTVEPIVDMRQQEYLTFSKAAVLMGCSRQYVYKLVGQGKLKASRLSSRMAFIRRADIEAMLEASPYNKVVFGSRPKKVSKRKDRVVTTEGDYSKPLCAGNYDNNHGDAPKRCTPVKPVNTDGEPLTYISSDDILTKYKVKTSWLYTTAKRNQIPMCKVAGKNYYSKKHVENCLGVSVDIEAIEEWMTAEEAGARYGIKPSSIHCYVYRHGVPTKREYGVVLYSKKHFDEIMRPDLLGNPDYMTVEQISQEYGLQPANIHHICKVNDMMRVKVGVKNLLLRAEVERVMAERAAKGL